MKIRIGDKRWWNAGWRWLWYRGRTLDGGYMFEDAGGEWFRLNREAVKGLKEKSWREE